METRVFEVLRAVVEYEIDTYITSYASVTQN